MAFSYSYTAFTMLIQIRNQAVSESLWKVSLTPPATLFSNPRCFKEVENEFLLRTSQTHSTEFKSGDLAGHQTNILTFERFVDH